GHLVQDSYTVGAEPAVAEADAVDRAHAAQHEVAERARHELLVRLQQDDLDRRIGQPHVLGRRRAAPAAADYDDPPSWLLPEVRDRGRATRRQQAEPDPRRSEEISPRPVLHASSFQLGGLDGPPKPQ